MSWLSHLISPVPGIFHDYVFFSSIGIPSSEYEGVVNPDDRLHRLEAVHLRGFDGRGTKSEDIYEYFKASHMIIARQRPMMLPAC